MTLNVGSDFKQRWLTAPQAVRQTFMDDLHRICEVLQPETQLHHWIAEDQRAQQQSHEKIEQAYAELKARLIEEARQRRQLALEKKLEQQRAEQAVQANVAYLQAAQLLAAGDLEKGKAAVAKLEGGKVAIYADLAGLRLAQAQVDAGQLEPAVSTLTGLKPEASLQPLTNLRLARVLTDTGKGEEALKLLGDANDSASLEARGDALVAIGKPDQARDLYLKALTGMDVAAPQRRLVELKLTDVGGTPPKPAQPT